MHPPTGDCDHGLVGESPQIHELRRLIGRASRSRLPVLLLGESGTGKEVVARAIHNAAPRGHFVPIDCGSLVGSLMESELFGHTKGAFSGAIENKKGLVEMAHGGTAFFDEIGDLPLELQVKLLRLLQENEFRPVGSLTWRKVDLRVIAATHRDLKREVAAGRFRQDLFYRLNVIALHLPPLRERKQDIPLLIDRFLGGAPRPYSLASDAAQTMFEYDWPGNVRELKNCIERMTALNSGPALHALDLPSALQYRRNSTSLERLSEAVEVEALPVFGAAPRSPVFSLPESEKQTILNALAHANGNRGAAAQLLHISRTTLYRKLKEYNIE
jgi:DNA-binding NtrC family response regulator